jgi:hypothetical protein
MRVAGDRTCLRRSLIIAYCGPNNGVVNIDLGRVYTVNSGPMRAKSTEYDKLFIREDYRVIIHALWDLSRGFSCLPLVCAKVKNPCISIRAVT